MDHIWVLGDLPLNRVLYALTMYQFLLIRHGETAWNKENRLQGHLDSPLTANGRQQAKTNGRRLDDVLKSKEFRIVSSPLGRCLETARIIADELCVSQKDISTDNRLKELCYGDWEGLKKSEITSSAFYKRRTKDRWNIPAPNGESYGDVAKRLSSWLASLRDELLVVVSHGCTGRVLRGIHDGLTTEEIAALDESHQRIFRLDQGRRSATVA